MLFSVFGTVLAEYGSRALRARSMRREKEVLMKIKERTPIEGVSDKAISVAEVALLSENGDRRAAFLKLTSEIESTLKKGAALIPIDADPLSAISVMNALLKRGIVDPVMADALRNIWLFRNQVIHGSRISERDLQMANDLSIILLTALYSLKTDTVD